MSVDPVMGTHPAAPMVEAKPTPAIRVRHLWHRFGRFDVLRDVSFDVAHGEIFGFIGPNGAGKTTTIRVMSTLLEPLAGRVEIDGYDVTIDPVAVRRIIGYMPDHAGVYDRVTVREYLEFFADAYRVPTAGTSYAVVDAVMELTDLTKLRDKLVATMSKGMKQRLQLARTLLHDPKVLILDEPASDLDPRARIEIRDLLVELRGLGKTIFLSSHILTELADVCTSVAILERGRLVVSGPISEIARRLQHAAPPQAAVAAPFAGAPAGATAAPAPAIAPAPAPQLPTHTVKLRVLAPGEAAAAALAGMPHVLRVGPGPGQTVLVTYTGNEQTVAYIVRALVMANVPVAGVEPERNELERIFLEVTKGEVQ
ncbi:ABC transporter ATP-binding protein [Pendulispora albinea]|uniref:ABC transporter ATP-binding protein n=1 Tax=Pendulispora albinea TaxID=2741071 RepID=A0ABZ2M8F1_9BACT